MRIKICSQLSKNGKLKTQKLIHFPPILRLNQMSKTSLSMSLRGSNLLKLRLIQNFKVKGMKIISRSSWETPSPVNSVIWKPSVLTFYSTCYVRQWERQSDLRIVFTKAPHHNLICSMIKVNYFQGVLFTQEKFILIQKSVQIC